MPLSNFNLVMWHLETGVSKSVGFSFKPFHAHAREVSDEWGFFLRYLYGDGFEETFRDLWGFTRCCSCLGNRCDISPEAAAEIVARHAHRDRLERLK